MGLYDTYLTFRIARAAESLPETVALVITERDLLEHGAYDTLSAFFHWAFEYGAERVTVYVSVLDPAAAEPLARAIEETDAPRPVAVREPDDTERADAAIQVSIGLGGKHEFARAVRAIARDVASGDLDPADVDSATIDDRLVFHAEPDLVIKTGTEHLSDFMIWQSVYSELYFTDVNWRDFRRRDYLRALRDYQDRQRRYGR